MRDHPDPTRGNLDLFTGTHALGAAVEQTMGVHTTHVADISPGACKLLAHNMPHTPNLGDVTNINWDNLPRPHTITAGTPCTDLSTAGRRLGMTEGTRSNLWVMARDAIAHLRPDYFIWENVRGALSATATSTPRGMGQHPGPMDANDPIALRALGRVLGDLADLGFDAEWCGLRASDVGAPHQRFRIFLLARNQDILTRPHTPHPHNPGLEGRETLQRPHQRTSWPVGLGDEPSWVEPFTWGCPACGGIDPDCATCNFSRRVQHDWGDWKPAIEHWEKVTGAEAPPCYDQFNPDEPVLSPHFSEWLMGLPRGWITDVTHITPREMSELAGNGVNPYQAYAALKHLRTRYGLPETDPAADNTRTWDPGDTQTTENPQQSITT